jgi:hypothetical protein
VLLYWSHELLLLHLITTQNEYENHEHLN